MICLLYVSHQLFARLYESGTLHLQPHQRKQFFEFDLQVFGQTGAPQRVDTLKLNSYWAASFAPWK